MKKNKGISLIVLVITIIVMIILAGSIILSLSNNGIIGKANEAVEMTNLKQVQTLAQLKWSEAYLDENVPKTTSGLSAAIKLALTQELGPQVLEDYKIKVTVNGVTVEEKENTEIISIQEIRGADKEFKYVKLANGDIQITRYVGTETEVIIPATYDGYDVYAIGNIDAGESSAQRYNIWGEENSTSNTTITSLTISEGIKEIKTAAFSKCSGLVGQLILPSTLEKINAYAFNQCTKLEGYLEIPEGLAVIGSGAFVACSLIENLKLPSTLEKIEDKAFLKCTGLKGDLVIPEGVNFIGYGTFSECGFNGNLILPSTLKSIGQQAFSRCSGLTGTLVIPENVLDVGAGAFEQCSSLTSLVFEGKSKLTQISQSMFAQCTNLSGDLIIPEGVTAIGLGAFNGAYCGNSEIVGKLTVPSTLESIGDRAFLDCSKLTGTVPNTVVLGETPFDGSGITVAQ